MSTITRMKTKTRLSAIVIHNDTVYLAGQTGGNVGTIKDQATLMLDKVAALLAEAGSSREHMLAATVYLKNMQDAPAFNEVWDAWLLEGHAPARTCVNATMNNQDVLCEVSVIAALAR